MKRGITTANRRKSNRNVSIKVTRVFLAEYLLADKLYNLVVRQLTETNAG